MTLSSSRILVLVAMLGLLIIPFAVVIRAAPPATDDFQRTWARTDRPVSNLSVSRTWMWGPEGFTGGIVEDYLEAPGGQRTVQYFDKSRMEDNSYRASEHWDVTNGLLVVEMMTGQMQVGDASFQNRSPAAINVGGDADDPTGPTYVTMAAIRTAPPLADGQVIEWSIDRNGTVSQAPSDVPNSGVTAQTYVPETNHRVASAFWEFMNSSGPVWENGELVTDQLFLNPYYATGFPVTEAYWAEIKVAGTYKWVLIQAFERRVLTYTPGNPPGWRVEAGNVGQHYYAWRYPQQPPLTPTATQPGSPTATATSSPTGTATASPTATQPEPQPATNYRFVDRWGERHDPTFNVGQPMGIDADSQGNLYIVDPLRGGVSKFTANGEYLTRWGGIGNPLSLAVSPQDEIYVGDNGPGGIIVYNTDGAYQFAFGTQGTNPGQFTYIHDLDIEPSSGNVYVAVPGRDVVLVYSSAGTFLFEWGGTGAGNSQFNSPSSILVFGPRVYVADYWNDRVKIFDLSGQYEDQWIVQQPSGLAVDGDGRIYIGSDTTDQIYIFGTAGAHLDTWGGPGSGDGQFNNLRDILVHPNGQVYVADTINGRIQTFLLDGTFWFKWWDDRRGRFATPLGMALSHQGDFWIADHELDRIVKMTNEGRYVTQRGSHGSGIDQFNGPRDVAADSNGFIYVADRFNHRIVKYDPGGTAILSWGSQGSGPGQFNEPHAVTVDEAGNVYVVDTLNHRVQKFTNTGTFVTEWGANGQGDGQFDSPGAIQAHIETLYVVDTGNNRIQYFDFAGNYIGQWGSIGSADGQFDFPTGIAIDSEGLLYITDGVNSRVQKFSGAGEFIAAWGAYGTGEGQFDWPADVIVVPNGDVYVLDSQTGYIQRFEPVG